MKYIAPIPVVMIDTLTKDQLFVYCYMKSLQRRTSKGWTTPSISIRQAADRLNMSPTTVSAAINKLIGLGWIEVANTEKRLFIDGDWKRLPRQYRFREGLAAKDWESTINEALEGEDIHFREACQRYRRKSNSKTRQD